MLAADQSCRIDAEFFKKEDIARLKTINCLNWDILRNVTYKIDVGFVGAMQTEYTKDVTAPILLQTRNIGEFLVDDNDVLHINNAFHNLLKKSQINCGDILIARSGSFGNAAIWLKTGLVNSSDIIIVGTDRQKINPFYLVAILNSKYGRFQLERFASGAVQGHVNLTILENLKIPLLSDSLQRHIEKIVDCAHGQMTKARHEYLDAEKILLSELGFDGWTPTEESVSVKNCSDFMSVGRFDAEYFQPKYDELFTLLAKCKVRVLGGKDGLVDIKRSIEPGSDVYSDKGIPFVRIADFTEMGVASPEIHIPPELCSDSPRPKKDTILLSKDGSVGIAYKVEEDLDIVTSSGILHLTVKDNAVLPDYLTLVLNSKIVRLQAERSAGGSIIQHWKQSEIENVSIPILPMSSQQKITAKVRESFALRAESKRLLDLAKRAVEVAIERGEEKALYVIRHKHTK